ncbi:MAG: phosphate signaling complex protein PhoU [Bdellovibrionales bacterium]|nr:phosphate signaling complex protein PhoU [Bdellovibrionales bacterium]
MDLKLKKHNAKIKNMKAKKQNITRFRSRLDERLNYMKSLACSMGECVEQTISDTQEVVFGKAVLEQKLTSIKKREDQINSLQLKLSKACFRALARQAPVAKDLRLILTCLYANTDLERMGDLAINIAHRTKKMDTDSSLDSCYTTLEKMFQSTIQMVQLSMQAFMKEDTTLAKNVLEMDDVVDSCQTQIKEKSKKVMQDKPHLVPTGVEFIIVSNGLERIADHSTNIAEEIIFLQTGYDIRHGS